MAGLANELSFPPFHSPLPFFSRNFVVEIHPLNFLCFVRNRGGKRERGNRGEGWVVRC